MRTVAILAASAAIGWSGAAAAVEKAEVVATYADIAEAAYGDSLIAAAAACRRRSTR